MVQGHGPILFPGPLFLFACLVCVIVRMCTLLSASLVLLHVHFCIVFLVTSNISCRHSVLDISAKNFPITENSFPTPNDLYGSPLGSGRAHTGSTRARNNALLPKDRETQTERKPHRTSEVNGELRNNHSTWCAQRIYVQKHICTSLDGSCDDFWIVIRMT